MHENCQILHEVICIHSPFRNYGIYHLLCPKSVTPRNVDLIPPASLGQIHFKRCMSAYLAGAHYNPQNDSPIVFAFCRLNTILFCLRLCSKGSYINPLLLVHLAQTNCPKIFFLLIFFVEIFTQNSFGEYITNIFNNPTTRGTKTKFWNKKLHIFRPLTYIFQVLLVRFLKVY